MPFSILKNPFSEPKKRKKDDAELVGELLGPEEEAEMREAMRVQAVEKEAERDDTIRLSEEEEAAKKAVEEELTPEQQRKQEYVQWAEEFGKDEDWVYDTFIFNDDGSVEVEGGLLLTGTDVTRFPSGLKSVGGYLGLRGCAGLTSLEHLPSSIGDYLYLIGCTGLTSLEHLPSSIGGDLDLRYCTQINDIPEGIQIEGVIRLDEDQTELKANAEAKGYKVKVI